MHHRLNFQNRLYKFKKLAFKELGSYLDFRTSLFSIYRMVLNALKKKVSKKVGKKISGLCVGILYGARQDNYYKRQSS